MTKRIISILTTLVMVVGIVANVNLSAYASMLEFDINKYIADFLSDNYSGEAVYDKSVERKYLEYYSDPQNASPALVLLKEMHNNSTFMAGVSSWEVLTFNPSNITENMLDRKGYYEAILFNILDCEIKSASFDSDSISAVSKLSLNISNSCTEMLKTNYNIDYDKICNTSWDEIYPDIKLQLINSTGTELYKWDSRNAKIKELSDIVDTASTVKSYIETAAKFGQLYKCQEDVKAVLYDLYSHCSSTDTAMKTALYETYNVCGNSFNAFQTDLVNGVLTIGSKSFSDIVGLMWNDCIASLSTSGITSGMLIGQTIGKSISNFMFSSDKTVEQYYVINALCNFENLMYESMWRLESEYKNNSSSDNAKIFLRAIDMLFATKELGCDYTTEFANIVFTEGIINKITNGDKNETYLEFIDSVANIKKIIQSIHSELLDIDSYIYYLEVDYPELYEFYKTTVETSESYFTYTINNNEVTITGLVDGYEPTYLNIPSTIEGKKVTCIGDAAFQDYYNLTCVTIPYGVTNIEYNAFFRCKSLISITIPNSVTSIGDSAFHLCGGLTSLTIPNGVTYIGAYAFACCYSLTSITIPNSVISIGDSAFIWSALTEIKVDSNNKNYSSKDGVLFNYDKTELIQYPICNKQENYNIPNSVINIGYRAFEPSNLVSIKIPNSVKSIGNRAFNECGSLTSITIPNSVTSIGYGVFVGCDSLTSIAIPDSVTSIGDWAFSECGSLTSITIPNSVTSIGYGVFMGCDSLTIKCYHGSYAEKYAIENNIKYELLDISTIKTPQITTKPNTKSTAPTAIKKAKIKNLNAKANGKKLTVSWKKIKNAKGYQVQAATNKKFKKKQIVFDKKTKKKKITIKGNKIKKNRIYYIRLRAYTTSKNADGKPKYTYSKWTKRKVKNYKHNN